MYLNTPQSVADINTTAGESLQADEIHGGIVSKSRSLIINRHYDQKESTIKSIVSNRKVPNKFRLRARIVDYFPLNLVDFTVRQCDSCRRLYVLI